MYHLLGRYYDRVNPPQFTAAILEQVSLRLAEAGLVPPGRLLEVGCGAGSVSLAMAGLGWEVVGLDLSPEMLALARQQEERQAQDMPARRPVTWCQGDLLAFQLDVPARAVFSFGDCMDHFLTPDSLGQAFSAVFRNLAPGGYFLFDMNGELICGTLLPGRKELIVDGKPMWFDGDYDPETGRVAIHFGVFEQTPTGVEEHRETILERYYPPPQVEALLQAAGFEAVTWEPLNFLDLPGLEDPRPQKTFWQCRRPLAGV